MNTSDKIAKDAKILVESVKDTLTSNILSAHRSKLVSLDESQLNKLISIINVSSDEGYQKALPVFQNMVKKSIPANTKNSK